MEPLTPPEMFITQAVAQKVNEIVNGYNYLVSVVQTAEPHAIADMAELRRETDRLRADNERLIAQWCDRAEISELLDAQLAIIRACPATPVIGLDAVDVRVPGTLWREIMKAPAVGTGAGE